MLVDADLDPGWLFLPSNDTGAGSLAHQGLPLNLERNRRYGGLKARALDAHGM